MAAAAAAADATAPATATATAAEPGTQSPESVASSIDRGHSSESESSGRGSRRRKHASKKKRKQQKKQSKKKRATHKHKSKHKHKDKKRKQNKDKKNKKENKKNKKRRHVNGGAGGGAGVREVERAVPGSSSEEDQEDVDSGDDDDDDGDMVAKVFRAAYRGYIDTLRHALDSDAAAVNAVDGNGLTPLHVAARYGKAKACEVLLERGCEVMPQQGASTSQRNEKGESARSLGLMKLLREVQARRERAAAGIDEATFQREQRREALRRAADEAEWQAKLGVAGAEDNPIAAQEAFQKAWFADEAKQHASAQASMAAAAGYHYTNHKRKRDRENGSSNTANSSTKYQRTKSPEAAPPDGFRAGTTGDFAARAASAPRLTAMQAQSKRSEEDEAFEAFNVAKGVVRLDDVPWPDLATGRVVGVYGLCIDDSMEYSAKRDRIRAAQRRWHPDKFGQRFGERLHADDRDAILKRVKEVAQAINAMGEQLKAEKG